MLEVYIDGACEPINPGGTASYGVVVLRQSLERYGAEPTDVEPIVEPVWEEGKVVGSGPKMSNNVAEYAGLIAFLEWYQSQYPKDKDVVYSEEATVYSDSQLLVNQMSRKWKVRKGLYVPYFTKAVELMVVLVSSQQAKFEFEWISRYNNTYADALAVKALAEVGIVRRK